MGKRPISISRAFITLLFALFWLVLGFPNVQGQVSAQFGVSQTGGCGSFSVTFSDSSTGPVTSWLWDFGNGNTSTFPTASAIYNAVGTYTVSLTVSDGVNSDTETKTNVITVFPNPNADFVGDTLNGCVPFLVSFSDSSSVTGTGISSWLWDFGDGNIAYAEDTAYSYMSEGNYSVTLIVTDSNGCTDSRQRVNYVQLSEVPVVGFTNTPTITCDPPLLVSFTDTSSGSTSLNYFWDFGNGDTSTLPNPSENYLANGSYDISLVVTDANGCADSVVKNKAVDIGRPAAIFGVDTNVICVGGGVQFTDSSTGAIDSWAWDFGEGTVDSIPNPFHVYDSAGVFPVTLVVTNSAGCADTLVQSALITADSTPTANFTQDTSLACDTPFTVTFSDQSIGGPVSWLWDFGDGTTDTLQNPVHTYTTFGTFSVSLRVSNGLDCSDSITFSNLISILPPTANFAVGQTGGCINTNFGFTDLSTSPNDPITSWNYDFGDASTSTLQNPSHMYTNQGTYPVSLIISTQNGCVDTFVFATTLDIDTLPAVDFGVNPVLECVSEPVSLSDSSAVAVNSWTWDFGDGNSTTAQNPVHNYAAPGTYTVTMTACIDQCCNFEQKVNQVTIQDPLADINLPISSVCNTPYTFDFYDNSSSGTGWGWDFGDGNLITGNDSVTHTYAAGGVYRARLVVNDSLTGCKDTSSILVFAGGFQANFGADTITGCSPLTVDFVDSSSNSASWIWDFGDGNLDSVQNPSHTYTDPGSYTVSLIMTDSAGCIDTLVRTSYIEALGPYSDFSADTTSGCLGLPITFFDNSTPAGSIASWNWIFGDGSNSGLQNPFHVYSSAGLYNVGLVVTDTNGCTDYRVKTAFVNIGSVTADFNPVQLIRCPGLPINFQNNSVGASSYAWDFGDGNVDSTNNANHTYSSSGNYPVTLIASSSSGCRDTFTYPSLIQIGTPNANFGANQTTGLCFPFVVSFTDSSGGGITSYDWDFGDGTGSTSQNPSHVYATSGNFTVTLIVRRSGNCRDTIVKTNFISVQGPGGSFTISKDSGCTPLQVDFVATYSNAATLTWDFGDGTVISGTDSISHTYLQSGSFTPSLLLDDGLGCTFTYTSPDSVSVDSFPAAGFSPDMTRICGTDTVSFLDTSVSGRPLVSWAWDFGDGGTDSVQNPVHYYANAGIYDVSLVVSHNLGCADTVVYPGLIQVSPPPQAGMLLSDTLGCPDLNVLFSQNNTLFLPLDTVVWDFGDGNLDTTGSPTHNYPNSGNYLASLTIRDTLGCIDTAFQNVFILNNPVPDFSASDTLACAPLPIQFTDLSSGQVQSWVWDFGNGNTDTLQNPVNLYTNKGTYDISLTVMDSAGCIDSIIYPGLLELLNPEAGFKVDTQDVCQLLELTMVDTSIADTTLLSWIWDPGDGSGMLSGDSVQHLYGANGTYQVSLMIENAIGCRDTIRDSITIRDRIPAQPKIHFVSVLGGDSDSLEWSTAQNGDFERYVVYREISGVFVPIDSLNTISDTTWTDLGINTQAQPYCYRLVAVDSCGRRSLLDSSRTHCTIDLSAQAGNNLVSLSWTPYVGWPNVGSYQVYRCSSYDTSATNLIGTVSGNTLSFIDSNATCYQVTCYRIKAIENGTSKVSWSDTACAEPIHTAPITSMEVVRATVENNQDVRLDWFPPSTLDPMEIYLEREDSIGNWSVWETLPPNQVTYLDTSVNVSDKAYAYRLTVLDSCGDFTPLSNTGRSMLLTLDNSFGATNLTWTAYGDWQNGVGQYIIETQIQGGVIWTQVASVGGNVFNFTDEETEFGPNVYCYRIRALEQGGNNAVSYSNEVCLPPNIWIPNTITPNGDGANDYLVIPALVHFQPGNELVIYNRWGNVIYEAAPYNNTWDGTNSQTGEDVPDGNYFYVLTLSGTGQKFTGYIHVHR